MATAEPDSWSPKEFYTELKGDLTHRLDRQDDMLTGIRGALDGKADKADVAILGSRLDGHGERLDSLEVHRQEVEQARAFRRRAWAVAGSVAGLLAVIGAGLITAFVH